MKRSRFIDEQLTGILKSEIPCTRKGAVSEILSMQEPFGDGRGSSREYCWSNSSVSSYLGQLEPENRQSINSSSLAPS